MRRRVGSAVVASLALSGVLTVPALARGPVATHWSLGREADLPARGDVSINGLSCPGVHLCVGVDSRGAIIRTATPARATSRWRRLLQPWAQGLAAVSCPSLHFCVAVGTAHSGPHRQGGRARVLSSGHPAAARRWRDVALPRNGPRGQHRFYDLQALSCPSARLCVAAADFNGLFVSTDPAGSAGTWHQAEITAAAADQWDAVSCPLISFCVAGDLDSGAVAVSADPSGGVRAWHRSRIVRGDRALHGISALSCPSRRFCLIGGEQGGVRWSTDPGGGPRAWHHAEIVPGPGHWPITAVSCRSARFCVAIDSRSRAYTSTDPEDGLRSWHATRLDTARFPTRTQGFPLTALACAPVRVCVAAGEVGDVFVGRTASAPGG